MTTRKSLSLKRRFEVFKRDSFRCQYCGANPPSVVLEVDHIAPVCEGGGNDISNLITSCFNCNRGKKGIPLADIPETISEIGKKIKEKELQLAGYREIVQIKLDRIESDVWKVANVLFAATAKDGVRVSYLKSIEVFVKRLDLHEIIDAAEIATFRKPYSENQKVKYFCGICWNKIKEGGGNG